MPLYVFACSQGHRTEELVRGSVPDVKCWVCGEAMARVYGYSMALTQPEPDTRGIFRRFLEASEERAESGVAGPNLWQAAKGRAGAMIEAGEVPASARRVW